MIKDELGSNRWSLTRSLLISDILSIIPIVRYIFFLKDAVDAKLKALRDDRGYSYADIITVHPDHLPQYETKLKAFFEEHIHDAEEIRFVLGGSGYFDVRDFEDNWVRVHVKKGDLMTLPEGIYHRFTCDEENWIHAMRLFIGQPIWTPFNRPQEEHPSRKKYVEEFVVSEEKKDESAE
jgi:1,2-dihydroxy-3-keto-5-methylthiopentene dioxygenase